MNTRFLSIRILFTLLLAVTTMSITMAQPSGGPYGPVKQNYTLPKTAGTVFYVAPDGNPDAPGKVLTGPTTLESALKLAKTGDFIVLRGGTYRTGDLKFNQGITIQPCDRSNCPSGYSSETAWIIS